MSPGLLNIAWTFLSQNEPGCVLLKAPCNAGNKAEGTLHRGRVLAPREPGWIPGLEDVGPHRGNRAGPWEQEAPDKWGLLVLEPVLDLEES